MNLSEAEKKILNEMEARKQHLEATREEREAKIKEILERMEKIARAEREQRLTKMKEFFEQCDTSLAMKILKRAFEEDPDKVMEWAEEEGFWDQSNSGHMVPDSGSPTDTDISS